MRVTINEKEVVIPSSLSEITLGKNVQYERQYGAEHVEILKSIQEMEEGLERDLEYTTFIKKKQLNISRFIVELNLAA